MGNIKLMKKGGSVSSGIHIKSSHKGRFGSYCRSKGYDGVTSACIAEGKRSNSSRVRKMATFAGNARKWNK